jgi:hypothetical protein
MTKSTPRKPFAKGGSLNVEGKAAWDDHRRRQPKLSHSSINLPSSLSNTPPH